MDKGGFNMKRSVMAIILTAIILGANGLYAQENNGLNGAAKKSTLSGPETADARLRYALKTFYQIIGPMLKSLNTLDLLIERNEGVKEGASQIVLRVNNESIEITQGLRYDQNIDHNHIIQQIERLTAELLAIEGRLGISFLPESEMDRMGHAMEVFGQAHAKVLRRLSTLTTWDQVLGDKISKQFWEINQEYMNIADRIRDKHLSLRTGEIDSDNIVRRLEILTTRLLDINNDILQLSGRMLMPSVYQFLPKNLRSL